MGVQLTDLITPRPIGFRDMSGRRIAIDALNALYQFLAIIRQPDGTPLKDSRDRITSHLSGLFYRNANLIEYGILPIYVFDGKPHRLKGKVVEERKRAREEAAEKWKAAIVEKKIVEARTYAQQAARVTDEILEDSKELLGYLGIPWVQAPSEGESQAAAMVAKGDAWAVGSQDYDSLLFGATRLIRNLTISGRRKIPRKEAYVEISPEIIHLEEFLASHGLRREQLVEVAILIGTDYNPKGVEGIGPKRALAMIKEHGSIAEGLKAANIELDLDIEEIKGIFLEPDFEGNYDLRRRPPDEEKLFRFLCYERDFSKDRVEKALERYREAKWTKSQSNLDSFFG